MDQDPGKIPAEGSELEMVNVQMTIPFPDTFVYSNASAYSVMAMDIKIGFAEAMPNRTVQPRVGVTIPIEHAVHMVISLIGQLDAFEQHFGHIRDVRWHALRDQLRKVPDSAVESGTSVREME